MIARRRFVAASIAGALASRVRALARRPASIVSIAFPSVGDVAAQAAAKVARIGILLIGASDNKYLIQRVDAFRSGMRDLGYVEGRDFAIEFRWADEKVDRLPALAAALVALNVDVIVTAGSQSTRAAMKATSTIPIVFATAGDAVSSGIVTNLARPGGNVTGSTFFSPELTAKRIELLKEAFPAVTNISLLLNHDNPGSTPVLQASQATAETLKLRLRVHQAGTEAEVKRAMSAIGGEHADALVMFEDPLLVRSSRVIADAALRHRIPSAAGLDFVEAGGLIGYGVRLVNHYRDAALLVDRILKGAKPGDLPVTRPTKFELVLNLRTATALGMRLPQSMILRADNVVR